MSGLVSPRPVSYNSYNPYARNIPPPYADSPINVGPGIPIHTPSQAVGVYAGTSPAIPPVAHEEQKVYGLVIDLLNPEKRESALLELSKKREQYDDLALVLWHSFGACCALIRYALLNISHRYYAGITARDCLRLPTALSAEPHGTCLQPGLQRTCPVAVRRVPPGDSSAFPQW